MAYYDGDWPDKGSNDVLSQGGITVNCQRDIESLMDSDKDKNPYLKAPTSKLAKAIYSGEPVVTFMEEARKFAKPTDLLPVIAQANNLRKPPGMEDNEPGPEMRHELNKHIRAIGVSKYFLPYDPDRNASRNDFAVQIQGTHTVRKTGRTDIAPGQTIVVSVPPHDAPASDPNGDRKEKVPFWMEPLGHDHYVEAFAEAMAQEPEILAVIASLAARATTGNIRDFETTKNATMIRLSAMGKSDKMDIARDYAIIERAVTEMLRKRVLGTALTEGRQGHDMDVLLHPNRL